MKGGEGKGRKGMGGSPAHASWKGSQQYPWAGATCPPVDGQREINRKIT